MIKSNSHGTKGWAHTPDAWSPLDISTLQAWYRSDDLTTGTITTWADKTANGRDLTGVASPTIIADAINGHKAARLNGTSQYLEHVDATFRNADGICAYLVMQFKTALVINDYIIDNRTSAAVPGAGMRVRDSSNNLGLRISSQQANDTNPLAIDTWYTLGAVWNQSVSSKIIYDGTERSVSLATTPVNGSGLIIGAYGGATPGGFCEMDVAEIICTSAELSAGDKTSLASYIASRYGI